MDKLIWRDSHWPLATTAPVAEALGIHASLMTRFPVHVIIDERLGLSGAARLALIAAREHQAGERRQGERQ